MRRKFYQERVCCCSPTQGMVYMQARVLKTIADHEMRSLRCAATCGRKAQKAMALGDLCVEAHHPLWALKVWRFAIREIHRKDYDDWVAVHFNEAYSSLQEVVSDGACELIGRRMDEVCRRLGLDAPKGKNSWEYRCGDGWYGSFLQEKYGIDVADWCERFAGMRDEAIARQTTARIFQEGQGSLPPQAQDFFQYWEDRDATMQNLYFKIDDWS